MTRASLITRRSGLDLRLGAASANGTFGELLQGALPDGTDFLVTLPIDRRSHARFRLDAGGALRVYPSHKWKALRLAQALLDSCGSDAGGTLVLDSDLPVGKGLASSSADLVATVRALGQVLDLDTSPEAVEKWLRPIEPTDGVMYPGVVAFEHRAVRLRHQLGSLPPLAIVAIDEGGQVDTVAYNRIDKSFSPSERDEYGDLLARLGEAIAAGDLAEIGAVTTRSAVLNQRLLPKSRLDQMILISQRFGGLGVVCAHSGTMIGILLPFTDTARLDAVRKACEELAPRTHVFYTLSDERPMA